MNADIFYGGTDTGSSGKGTSHVDEGTARSADVLYGSKPNVVKHDAGRASLAEKMFDNTVSSPAAEIAQLLEDHGGSPEDGQRAARMLDQEVNALGVNLSAREFIDTVSAPLPSQREQIQLRNETLAALKERYGAKAESLLADTNRWLRATAPSVAQAIGISRAGVDRHTVLALVSAHLKSRGR